MALDRAELRRLEGMLRSNIPFFGARMRRKAAEELLKDGSAEAGRVLVRTVMWGYPTSTRREALDAIRRTESQAIINIVCTTWLEQRNWALSPFNDLIVERGWIATSPVQMRVFTALKAGKRELIAGEGARVVKPLIDASGDSDQTIAEQAKLALKELTAPAAKDALCRLFLESENTVVREAVMALGCEPKDDSKRALFFFLTEQWSKYEAIDFDHRQLRVIYDTADAALRQRIAERLRSSGRADLLKIAVGGDLRSRAGSMGSKEAELLVQAVAGNREWPKLWELVFEAPLASSIEAVKLLVRSGWEPEKSDDITVFRELASLVAGEMAASGDDAGTSIPPAVRRARVRVPGRVNGVALSPTRPVIAIGTGQGKVVLWNYRQALREQVLTGFAHSIGRLAFAEDGSLVCAERGQHHMDPCGVYGWQGAETFWLGQHVGPVTTVEPAGGPHVITTGRDGRVVLWDVGGRSIVADRRFDFWCRAVCVSPDRSHVGLLHYGMHLATLPALDVVAKRTWTTRDVVSDGVFAPDDDALLLAKHGVTIWRKNGETLKQDKRDFSGDLNTHRWDRNDYWIERVALVPGSDTVITAGSTGRVEFYSYKNLSSIGDLNIPSELLTSLHISPDGGLLAVGDSDASMTLWDLRMIALPLLFSRPQSQASPSDLALVSQMAGDKGLPASARQSLRFAERVLKHRFRYDVQIDDTPLIAAGDFDIEVD